MPEKTNSYKIPGTQKREARPLENRNPSLTQQTPERPGRDKPRRRGELIYPVDILLNWTHPISHRLEPLIK